MERTIINRKELSERWGVTPQCIIQYEERGIITRLKRFNSPMYSLTEILRVEEADKEDSLLQLRQLKKRVKELEEENIKLTIKLNKIRQVLI